MKGGYQMLDLSGIDFLTSPAGTRITDPEIKANIINAITCGKPVLVSGFRGGHGPNFGQVYESTTSGEICATTGIDIPNNTTWAYSLVWNKTTGMITGYMKQYTLS